MYRSEEASGVSRPLIAVFAGYGQFVAYGFIIPECLPRFTMEELSAQLRNATEGDQFTLHTDADNYADTVTGEVMGDPDVDHPEPHATGPQRYDKKITVTMKNLTDDAKFGALEVRVKKIGGNWQCPQLSGRFYEKDRGLYGTGPSAPVTKGRPVHDDE